MWRWVVRLSVCPSYHICSNGLERWGFYLRVATTQGQRTSTFLIVHILYVWCKHAKPNRQSNLFRQECGFRRRLERSSATSHVSYHRRCGHSVTIVQGIVNNLQFFICTVESSLLSTMAAAIPRPSTVSCSCCCRAPWRLWITWLHTTLHTLHVASIWRWLLFCFALS